MKKVILAFVLSLCMAGTAAGQKLWLYYEIGAGPQYSKLTSSSPDVSLVKSRAASPGFLLAWELPGWISVETGVYLHQLGSELHVMGTLLNIEGELITNCIIQSGYGPMIPFRFRPRLPLIKNRLEISPFVGLDLFFPLETDGIYYAVKEKDITAEVYKAIPSFYLMAEGGASLDLLLGRRRGFKLSFTAIGHTGFGKMGEFGVDVGDTRVVSRGRFMEYNLRLGFMLFNKNNWHGGKRIN